MMAIVSRRFAKSSYLVDDMADDAAALQVYAVGSSRPVIDGTGLQIGAVLTLRDCATSSMPATK